MKAYMILFDCDDDYDYDGICRYIDGSFVKKHSKAFVNLENAKNYVNEVIDEEKKSFISFMNRESISDEDKKDWIEEMRYYKNIDKNEIVPGEFIETYNDGNTIGYIIIQEIEIMDMED